MSMNQRRPTGARTNPYANMTKSDVEHMVSQRGWRIVTERRNRGDWNECRDIVAVNETDDRERIIMDTVMKGERIDWSDIGQHFEKVAP